MIFIRGMKYTFFLVKNKTKKKNLFMFVKMTNLSYSNIYTGLNQRIGPSELTLFWTGYIQTTISQELQNSLSVSNFSATPPMSHSLGLLQIHVSFLRFFSHSWCINIVQITWIIVNCNRIILCYVIQHDKD